MGIRGNHKEDGKMTMYESEKNFLERIADAIPGIKGYRAKESRRDTDKRLREYIAGQIDRLRGDLSNVQESAAEQGKLELMDDLDRADRRLQKCADTIRFASYGYAGLFDQVKIREEELDEIYNFDNLLLDLVAQVHQHASELGASELTLDAVRGFAGKVGDLEQKVADRKNIFNTPV